MGKGGVGVRFRRLEWLEASRQQPPDSCQGGEPLAVAGCWSVTDSGRFKGGAAHGRRL
jgi:hypothetical protein